MKRYFFWALILVALTACKKDKKDKVTELRDDSLYTFSVEVKGFWTAKTHPTDFPSEAKFGKIVGISHRDKDLLFKEGQKPRSWMQSYFETNSTTDFSSYFKEYKDGDKVNAIVSEEGFVANGNRQFEFNTVGKHNKFSLLLQLSPSPDWFVAVNNINLNPLALGGYTTYIVSVFDAGLFSGNTYTEKGNSENGSISYKNNSPVNYPDGGINKFAVVTVQFKSVKKIAAD